MNTFTYDLSLIQFRTAPGQTTSPKPTLYLYLYHYMLTEFNGAVNPDTALKIYTSIPAHYFAILNTKTRKTKYTLLAADHSTILTTSVGVLLKKHQQFKKSLKYSYKAHTFLLKFVKNTFIKLIQQHPYVFILRGLNTKIFNLINLFNFLRSTSQMILYVVRPRISFSRPIFKKVKSIKRKLQRKNNVKVSATVSTLKNYLFKNFVV